MPSGGRAAAKRSCEATTKRGTPCRAIAAAGGWCIAHDPTRRDEVRAARAKGATIKNKLVALEGRRKKLHSAAALIAFTSDVVQSVLDGSVLPDVGRVALYGASVLRQLVEAGDLEKRLEALEAADRQHEKGPRWHA